MEFYAQDSELQKNGREKEFGLATGIVKENWDKEHLGKVKVEYFLGEKGKNLTGWIPVAMPYAGLNYGAYFMPEIGDMVVIGFDGGERSCPIVIGSIFSKVNTIPPETAKDKNQVKRLVTKGGCQILFDDEEKKEKIEITTPGKLKISIEDETQKICIAENSNDNGLIIDIKNGHVKLMAKQKLELCVGGESMVVLDGTSKAVQIKCGKMDVNANQAVNIKGSNTQIGGSVLALKGDSTAKMEAGGIMEVKGAMVKIN